MLVSIPGVMHFIGFPWIAITSSITSISSSIVNVPDLGTSKTSETGRSPRITTTPMTYASLFLPRLVFLNLAP